MTLEYFFTDFYNMSHIVLGRALLLDSTTDRRRLFDCLFLDFFRSFGSDINELASQSASLLKFHHHPVVVVVVVNIQIELNIGTNCE